MVGDDAFNAEFCFKWKIKKFSHCLPWTWIRSPTFTVESMDKTRWCLQLWPKQYTNGIHMEYYLAREEVDSGPEIIRIAFELSFLDHCGMPLVKRSRETSFTKDKNKGFSEFVEQAVVYIHKRFEYLPEDTLTACCRMRRAGELTQKTVFCSATTVIGVEQSSFDWNIDNFSKIRSGRKRTMRKTNPSVKIELSLTPKPEEALLLEISHAHMEEPNMTDCEISVLNSSKNAAYSKRDFRYLEGKVWEFPIFVKKSQLIAERNVCLHNDILVLKCNISISLGVVSNVIDGYRSLSATVEGKAFALIPEPSDVGETISTTQKFIRDLKETDPKLFNVERKDTKEILEEVSSEDSSSSMNESSSPTQNEEYFSVEDETIIEFDNKSFNIEEILPTSSMKEELQRFYQDGTFSDVHLTVGNETFPAHRLILSLRSQKFKELFLNDLSKRSIQLTDLDPGTLRDLLNFIYTNNVVNMTWEKAQKLFSAGERYQVMPLKHACLKFMTENINESNACNVLILADEQQDEQVKKLALEFFLKHGKSILKTKAWDELAKKNIKLAFETMQKMYLNKTSK
ncbi:Speckle-type POZ protein B like protein [Argiope bruennichi]|uniref:Speckle-type POZ protein B like protein n=1 Tax=Argiope bruennichi TaxID=94029 RepID=A0A8T0EGT9_ARGBR|nr:Speckle-type POZ protein B like protein [Argiope bruennichi]